MKFNLAKIFLDFYPEDMVKQFKKISLLFYFGLSLEFMYLILNINSLLHTTVVTVEGVFAFFFLFPIGTLILSFGLLLSSIHILRHNNPIVLYYMSFKKLILYVFNIGMILTSLIILFIYSVFAAHFLGFF